MKNKSDNEFSFLFVPMQFCEICTLNHNCLSIIIIITSETSIKNIKFTILAAFDVFEVKNLKKIAFDKKKVLSHFQLQSFNFHKLLVATY